MLTNYTTSRDCVFGNFNEARIVLEYEDDGIAEALMQKNDR